jgi:tetratricopeptide (TPR) repeat protein
MAGPPADDVAAPKAAADDGEAEIQRLYYEGAAKYSASDYDGAIDAFTGALEAAARQGASPSIREALLMNLGKAHVRAHELDGDPKHLKIARDIYRRLLREAPAAGYSEDSVSEAMAQVDALDRQLEQADTGNDKDAGAGKGPMRDDRQARRTRGIVLVTVGAVVLGGGAGLLGQGARFRPHAEQEIDKYDDPADAEQDFLDEQTRKGKILMGVGGGLAAVGVALVIVGAVDLARSKRATKTARIQAVPLVGNGAWGTALTGVF